MFEADRIALIADVLMAIVLHPLSSGGYSVRGPAFIASLMEGEGWIYLEAHTRNASFFTGTTDTTGSSLSETLQTLQPT